MLAIPDRGVLILEVKGGSIEVRDGKWLQNGRPMGKSPRAQAHSFLKKLREKLEERCESEVPWIAIATAFPDTPFSTPPSQGDLEGAVLGQQDLPHLDAALPSMADRLFASARRPRDARWIEVLHELWCATWTPRLSLGQRARLREEELVALDHDQLDLLDMIEHNPRFLVRGGPGTGKTLLAREMVRRLASRRPVFLCSTSALAAGLRSAGLEDAWTVRELAGRLLADAHIPMQGG